VLRAFVWWSPPEVSFVPRDSEQFGGAGPITWVVTWGVLGRPGFVVEHVIAWDPDEALVVAAQRRPDLPRPRVALAAS
jgi:hypothetical protein